MYENELEPRPERHPVISLIIVLALVGLGFVVVGPLIGFFIAIPFYEGSMMEMAEAVADPLAHPELKMPLYIMQGCATFIGLIVFPALYLTAARRSMTDFFRDQKTELIPIIITSLIVIIFMAVNSLFAEWNANIKFPEGFHEWARSREDLATELTTFMIQIDSYFELVVAMFVIAILPAIGEELVFRGLIQRELYRGTKNIHVAIWVAAILFSAIHMQFFGFVPRLLLGALFGYIYYWSGSLTLAIFAHFVNNGALVFAMYLHQKGTFEYDVESTEAVPANIIIISALLTAGLLYYFYQYFQNRKPPVPFS
jgi:uncharacterized protein